MKNQRALLLRTCPRLALVLVACGLSGCGPTSRDIAHSALIVAPAVLAVSYLLPLLYQKLMRRPLHPGPDVLIAHVATFVGLIMGAVWGEQKLPSGHHDLIPLVLLFASLSMVTYAQLGWLIWCYRRPDHRLYPMMLVVFTIMVMLPAVLPLLKLPGLDDDFLVGVQFCIWVLPGFYGLAPLALCAVCIGVVLAHRKKLDREDASTKVAHVFD